MKSIVPLAFAALCAVPAAHAATFTVTSLADSGAGSLRAAITAANAAAGADTIVFQPGLNGTITLSSGELLISDSLIIAGPGASRITIDTRATDTPPARRRRPTWAEPAAPFASRPHPIASPIERSRQKPLTPPYSVPHAIDVT